MANDPPFATLNHFIADLGIPGESASPRVGISMQTITTIGFDIAKSVFQVHGVDAAGQVIVCRQLKRRQVIEFFLKLPPCLA